MQQQHNKNVTMLLSNFLFPFVVQNHKILGYQSLLLTHIWDILSSRNFENYCAQYYSVRMTIDLIYSAVVNKML